MEEPKIQKNKWWGKQFLGANIALVLGILTILSSASQPYSGGQDTGWIIIIGYFIYKSAKKRSLGLVPSSDLRRNAEIVGLIMIFVYLSFFLYSKYLNVTDHPLPLVAFVWVLTAYLVVVYKKFFSDDKKKKIILALASGVLIGVVVYYFIYFLNVAPSTPKWINFTPSDSSFNVLLPTNPVYQQIQNTAGVNDVATYNQDIWTAKTNNAMFSIESFVVPTNLIDLSQNTQGVLTALVDGQMKKVAGGKISGEQSITYHSYPAIVFKGTGDENVVINGIYFITGQKVYLLFMVYNQSFPISKDDMATFIDSFKLR